MDVPPLGRKGVVAVRHHLYDPEGRVWHPAIWEAATREIYIRGGWSAEGELDPPFPADTVPALVEIAHYAFARPNGYGWCMGPIPDRCILVDAILTGGSSLRPCEGAPLFLASHCTKTSESLWDPVNPPRCCYVESEGSALLRSFLPDERFLECVRRLRGAMLSYFGLGMPCSEFTQFHTLQTMQQVNSSFSISASTVLGDYFRSLHSEFVSFAGSCPHEDDERLCTCPDERTVLESAVKPRKFMGWRRRLDPVLPACMRHTAKFFNWTLMVGWLVSLEMTIVLCTILREHLHYGYVMPLELMDAIIETFVEPAARRACCTEVKRTRVE